MKYKPSVVLFALMLLVSFGNAQEELPVLPADRPGNTWFAEVLPHHQVSWENGFGFESSPDGPGSKFNFGIAPLTIGTKVRVYESHNWLPSIGLLAEFQLPYVGSKDLVPSHLAPSMYLLFA